MRAKGKETLFREVIVERVRGGRGTKRVHGWLVAPVAVGGHLVVRQDDDRQMTSTPIRRLLVEDQGSHVVYVETQNSRYRVTFVSSSELQATVPSGAKTGPITVTNTAGTAGTVTSAKSFKVT